MRRGPTAWFHPPLWPLASKTPETNNNQQDAAQMHGGFRTYGHWRARRCPKAWCNPHLWPLASKTLPNCMVQSGPKAAAQMHGALCIYGRWPARCLPNAWCNLHLWPLARKTLPKCIVQSATMAAKCRPHLHLPSVVHTRVTE